MYTLWTDKGRTRDFVTISTWQKSIRVKTHFCKYFVQWHCSVYEARFYWNKMLLIGSYFAIFALGVRFLTDRLRVYTVTMICICLSVIYLSLCLSSIYSLSVCLSFCLSNMFYTIENYSFCFYFLPTFLLCCPSQ